MHSNADQSVKKAGLQTHLFHSSPQTVTSGTKSRQTKAREIDKVKNHENHDWHKACFADCVTVQCLVGVVKCQVAVVCVSESLGHDAQHFQVHLL